jgi:hypothetical protein
VLESRTRLERSRWSGRLAPFTRLSREACPCNSDYCRIVYACGVRPGASPASCTTPFGASRRYASAGCAPSRCVAGKPGATRSEHARLAVERSRSQRIEPPGAEPRRKRKSARLRTRGPSCASLCAAAPLVPAAVALSLAVPADAVVSATGVVPATRVAAVTARRPGPSSRASCLGDGDEPPHGGPCHRRRRFEGPGL